MKKLTVPFLLSAFCALVLAGSGCADMLAPHTTLSAGPVKWSNPKNMTADEITFTTDTNRVVKATIKKISTVMDPQVISISADGLAKILQTAIEAAGAIAGKAVVP